MLVFLNGVPAESARRAPLVERERETRREWDERTQRA